MDTWPLLHDAAGERYWDGLTLALDDRSTGAIYVFGYVVEMLLKVAFFRIRMVPGPHNLWIPLTLGGASPFAMARSHASWYGRPSLHNLEAWLRLLIAERNSAGPALDPIAAGEIETHVRVVDAHWRETLRYKSLTVSGAEINEVFKSVDWLYKNQVLLWS
jgi:hypothetical protein